MKKPDMVKVISIAGTVLGLVGTLASDWTNEKKMTKTIKEEVKKALENK